MNENASSEPTSVKPGQASMLKVLIPLMIVLMGISAFIYTLGPKQTPEYVPPPEEQQKVKTASELTANIATVKANKQISARDKERILGFLQAELTAAKEREGKTGAPATR